MLVGFILNVYISYPYSSVKCLMSTSQIYKNSCNKDFIAFVFPCFFSVGDGEEVVNTEATYIHTFFSLDNKLHKSSVHAAITNYLMVLLERS